MPPERYSVFVDVSAKIETWEKVSVVVVANGHSNALRLPAYVKKAMRDALRGGLEPPQYVIFAAAIYLTLRPYLSQIKRIRVDLDYSGASAERTIRRLLVEMIRRDVPGFRGSEIRLEEVSGTRADILARQCYRGKQPVNGEISLADMRAVLGARE